MYYDLKICPGCKSPLFEIGDVKKKEHKKGCDNCKRVWHWLGDMWVSEARPVKLKKEPRPGDTLDDFLEPI